MDYIVLNDMSRIKGVNIPKSDVGFKKMGKICDAAEALFDKKGFYDTSVADICSLAKTAVGTFYIYFQDKTSIYKYLVRNYYVVIKNYLHEQIAGCKTRYEMEREGIRAFIRFGNKHPQWYKIIWGSSHIDPVIFEEYYTRFAKGYIRALDKFSAELIDINHETAAWALMGIANFNCLRSILHRERLSEQDLNTIVDDVMKMLSIGLFKPSASGAKKKSGKAKI
jgi:AcrR family transcriptional regulator